MIFFLFGHTGCGKNYVADILSEKYGFKVLDADSLFSKKMMKIIKTGGVISPEMRQEFIQSIIDTTKSLNQKYPNLIVIQAFIKDVSRQQIKNAIPESVWVYVTTDSQIRYQRLDLRKNHFADSNYAKTMDSCYEEPASGHLEINNNLDSAPSSIIKQFDTILNSIGQNFDYKSKLAARVACIRANSISKILIKATEKNVISLAGGHPAQETLPVRAIKKINLSIFEKHTGHILQYGPSQGYLPLIQILVGYLSKRGVICNTDQIGISSGAQNAIDAAAKMLINKGDIVAIEPSTFFYSIQTLGLYEPRIIDIKSDENGIIPEEFEKACQKAPIKLIYLIPNFQNPTGRTLPLDRRIEIAAIARKYHVFIIEDDPYYELRYKNRNIPPIKAFAPEIVIYIGSFSKIFSPAMRLGYYVAPKEICELMTSIRQVDDIHANQYAQALACEYISQGYAQKNLRKANKIYSQRMESMLTSLDKYLDTTRFSYSRPDGGLFIWIKGPKNFDATAAYYKAIENGVSFVPGKFFFLDYETGNNCLRLNFTNQNPENITLAIKKLASVLNNTK